LPDNALEHLKQQLVKTLLEKRALHKLTIRPSPPVYPEF
jgi:hypothetical protein